MITGYKSKAQALTYTQSWLESKERVAQSSKWLEISKTIWDFSEKGGFKSIEKIWDKIAGQESKKNG